MSQYNTKSEPRSGGSSSYDMKPDPTPYELVVMENDDLRARLQLADERAFEQAATIARLKSDRSQLFHSIKVALTWMDAFRRQSGTNEAGPLAQDIKTIQKVIQDIA